MALDELIQVEEKLFGAEIVNRFTEVQWILLAFECFRKVVVATEAIRNGDVGLLDPPEHFLIQLLLEILGGPQEGIGIGIFRVEVGEHFRRFFVPKPVVVVDAAVAVHDLFHRFAPGDRRGRDRIRHFLVENHPRCLLGI